MVEELFDGYVVVLTDPVRAETRHFRCRADAEEYLRRAHESGLFRRGRLFGTLPGGTVETLTGFGGVPLALAAVC